MKIEDLKKRLVEKNLRLNSLKYDEKHCHSDSLRRQATAQIMMIEISISNLDTKIKELDK